MQSVYSAALADWAGKVKFTGRYPFMCCVLTFDRAIIYQLCKQEDSDAWMLASSLGVSSSRVLKAGTSGRSHGSPLACACQ